MKVIDRFASIIEFCPVSSSQENRLRRCRFVGEPEVEKEEEEEESDDSGEVPVDTTCIIMMSPPESPEDERQNSNNSPHNIYQIPPGGSLIANSNDRTVVSEKETTGGCTEGEKTVDLGQDTDMGFSEVELTQRFDSVIEVMHCESNRPMVLKRKLASNECISGFPSKKRNILDNNMGSESLNQLFMKSEEKLNSNRVSPCNCTSKSARSNQITEVSEGGLAKRKLEFSSEILELETGASDKDLGFNDGLENNIRNFEGDGSVCNNFDGEGSSNSGRKSIEDIDKFRYGPSAHDSRENNDSRDRDLGFNEGLETNIKNFEGDRSVCNNIDGAGNSNSGRKSIEDIDKFRYAGPSAHDSHEMERRTRMRALPVSICGQAEKNAGKESDPRKNNGEITLLDVLRMLAVNCDYDRSLENKSILDVAKSRGITFP